MLRRRIIIRRVINILQLLSCLLVVLFLVLPFIFKFSPWLQTQLVFLPSVRMLRDTNFSDPSSLGMTFTHNLYLPSKSGVILGVWHVLPASCATVPVCVDPLLHHPVVLYLHGNTGHRGSDSRVQLYKVLRDLDYNVIALDYRGFADSSAVSPSVRGVVEDAMSVYNWLATNHTQVIVWGHSLGAGIATHLVADLCTKGVRPGGVVLESPFNNIYDEIRNHRMSQPWRLIPFFSWFFTSPLAENDLAFVNDEKMSVIDDVPLLILHAEDDQVIPVQLGRDLHQAALSSRKSGDSSLVYREFDSELGYGHSHIYMEPGLPGIIKQWRGGTRVKNESIISS